MRTLVAIPCMDMVHTDFMRSCLNMEKSGEVRFGFAQSSLIYDSRNALANLAIEEGYDRVLWLDSDMCFDEYLFRRLSEHLDMGKEMISGLYFSRKLPIRPIIYKALYVKKTDAGNEAVAESFEDYPRDDLFKFWGRYDDGGPAAPDPGRLCAPLLPDFRFWRGSGLLPASDAAGRGDLVRFQHQDGPRRPGHFRRDVLSREEGQQ